MTDKGVAASAKGKPKTFNCPNCGGSVTVKAPGHTINAVCNYCSSIIDVANENLRLITTAHAKTRPTLLEPGDRGKLGGTRWEVIGYMEKTDGSGMYRWDEYLLFNPYQGFRFLAQANGHWNLLKVVKKNLPGAGTADKLRVDSCIYKIFLRGGAKTAYVKGEFYWRARAGEWVKVTDYVAPPFIVSVEQNHEEINIAVGEYVPADEVAKAFGIKRGMPYQRGVAPNQPNPYSAKAGPIWKPAFLALGLATVLQLLSSVAADKAVVLQNTWEIAAVDRDKTLGSDSFTLPEKTNVLIESSAPLNNDWLELGFALANENDAVYNAEQVIEYYSGTDEDGTWSEGSQHSDSFLAGVEGGVYRLLVDADAGALQNGRPVNFTVKITRDIPVWSNYWLSVLLLLAYPVYVFFRKRGFEAKRWAESDLFGFNDD